MYFRNRVLIIIYYNSLNETVWNNIDKSHIGTLPGVTSLVQKPAVFLFESIQFKFAHLLGRPDKRWRKINNVKRGKATESSGMLRRFCRNLIHPRCGISKWTIFGKKWWTGWRILPNTVYCYLSERNDVERVTDLFTHAQSSSGNFNCYK